MLFTQAVFFEFLLATFVIYYSVPVGRAQLAVLIAASLVFYAYDQPWLLLLLLLSSVISTTTSYFVLNGSSPGLRRLAATLGVIVNLSVLGFFKYASFFYFSILGGTTPGDGLVNLIVTLPLPIGISFYTFHGISLVLDAYKRGNVSGEALAEEDRHLGTHIARTTLYLTFFPQLIAGPIVKAHDFYPQIHGKSWRHIDWDAVISALIVGYFLKCVVADNLAGQTFWLAFPYFTTLSSGNLLALILGYGIQIFADFAGYSLIAIGLAHLFGYRLPDNFRFPYISQTFSEFWTRWHISLSSWLREYLYFPLGGNRKGNIRTYINLMIVMGLGGLWHGAAWGYVLWGLWHGTALVIERGLGDVWFYRSRLPAVAVARIAVVFTVAILGFVLFKLPHLDQAVDFFGALTRNTDIHFGTGIPLVIALYTVPVALYHAQYLVRAAGRDLDRLKRPALGLMLAFVVLNSGEGNAFIYFQF